MMEAEVLPPPRRHAFRAEGVKTLGLMGTFLALLTMAAAVGFGMLALFGKLLLASSLITVLWPLVFTGEFTQWVFGTPQIGFFKVFLLLLAAGTVVKLFNKGFKRG